MPSRNCRWESLVNNFIIIQVDTPVPEKIVTHIASDLKSSKNGNEKDVNIINMNSNLIKCLI